MMKNIEHYTAYKTCVESMFSDEIYTRHRQMVLRIMTEEVVERVTDAKDRTDIINYYVQFNERHF